MMKPQTLVLSIVSGFLFLAPVAKADPAAAPHADSAAKAENDCGCKDCKKNGKCTKKACANCKNHKGDAKAADSEHHS